MHLFNINFRCAYICVYEKYNEYKYIFTHSMIKAGTTNRASINKLIKLIKNYI